MALPTLAKTWQFDVNQVIYGSSTQSAFDALVIALKDSLKTFPLNPWTVWGSCDAVTAYNDDGTDCWVDETDIVHAQAGTAHSWIVLENTVTGMQFCIDVVHGGSTYYYTATLVGSFTGFSANGTTTTRPTATDEVVLVSVGAWIPNSAVTLILHVMHSTDGEETRVLVCYNDFVCDFILFGLPIDPISGWTTGLMAAKVNGGTANSPTYALFNDATAIYTQLSGVTTAMYATSEGFIDAAIGQYITYPDDDTGEWPMSMMGLATVAGVHRGRKGMVTDLYWGSVGVENCFVYTNTEGTSRGFVHFGEMIFPWDGSIPRSS